MNYDGLFIKFVRMRRYYMKKQSTIGGFAILSSAVLIVKILSLLYIPFIIAILGDEGWGVYQFAYLVFTLIFSVTNSGLPSAISKLISELTAVGNYKDALKAFKMSRAMLLTTGIVMSIILFFSAGFLSRESPKSYLAVIALCPTIILSTVTSSYRGYFQGRKNMIPTAVSQVLEQVVNIFFTLLLAFLFLRYGIEAACAGGTLATSIAALFAASFLVYMYKKNRESKIYKLHDPSVQRYGNKALLKKIIFYALPLSIYQALFYIGVLIDANITQTRLAHAGFNKVQSISLFGDLTKFNQLIAVPNAIIASLSVALLPAISAAVARQETKNVKDKINAAFKICFIISIPAAVGLSTLSYPIFELLHIHGGAKIMYFGAYVLILMSCVQVFSAILQGLGKLYIVTAFLAVGVVGKIITNYFLVAIPEINIMGAIFGNVVYYIVPLILDNIILLKILKIKINIFTHAIKPAIASVAMGITIFLSYNGLHGILSFVTKFFLPNAIPPILSYAINAVPTIIAMGVGAYTYFYVLVLIKGITKGDMNMVPSKLKKFIPRHIQKAIQD